jgi:hypothetical protein
MIHKKKILTQWIKSRDSPTFFEMSFDAKRKSDSEFVYEISGISKNRKLDIWFKK